MGKDADFIALDTRHPAIEPMIDPFRSIISNSGARCISTSTPRKAARRKRNLRKYRLGRPEGKGCGLASKQGVSGDGRTSV